MKTHADDYLYLLTSNMVWKEGQQIFQTIP